MAEKLRQVLLTYLPLYPWVSNDTCIGADQAPVPISLHRMWTFP